MDTNSTKYQITKTVRFKLELNPLFDVSQLVSKKKNNDFANISDLVDKLEHFLSDFKNIIFNDVEQKKWNYDLSVKYRWLKTYMKNDFFNRTYNSHSSVKQVSIKELDYVRTYFNEKWLIEFKDILNRLGEFVVDDAKTHLYTKKTIIADQLWKLSKRTTLELAFTFIGALKSTNGEINKSILTLYYKQTEIENAIKNLQQVYAPNQSNGLFVLGASFNYFTINKRPKKYTSEISNVLYQLQNKKISLAMLESNKEIDPDIANLLRNDTTYEYQKKNKNDKVRTETIYFNKEYDYDDLVAHLKNWRSFQFRMFNEAVQKLESKESVSQEEIDAIDQDSKIVLLQFVNTGELKHYIQLKQQRFDIQNKQNEDDESNNNDELESIERELDSYFVNKTIQVKKGTLLTDEVKKSLKELQEKLKSNLTKLKYYQKFCRFLMLFAGKQGRLKQDLNGLKKDQTNCELLGYWSFIYEDINSDRWLYLISREKMSIFKNKLSEFENDDVKSKSARLYYINSLTLRSLRKLVFDTPSFKKSLFDNTKSFKFSWVKSPNDILKFKIQFYQEVLWFVFKNQQEFELDLSNYNILALKKVRFDSDEDFERNLAVISNNTLTLKYLEELVFRTQSFKRLFDRKKNFKYCYIKSEKDIKKNEIQFYQEVLKFVSNNQIYFELDLSSYEISTFVNMRFKSIEDFEAKLNSICYKRVVKVDANIENTMKEFSEGLFFKITSQELRNPKVNRKPLTENWINYWNDDSFITRLNPEIKILWRNAREHAIKNHDPYIYKNIGIDYEMHNRYIKEQFTLVTTFTINADKQRIETAYKNIAQKIDDVEDFNNKLKSLHYAVGIDEGTKDLATITLVKKEDGNVIPQRFKITRLKKDVYNFENQDNYVMLKNGEKINLYNFALPYINKKNDSKKQFYVLLNPSYFLNKELFNKVFPTYNFDEIKNLLFEEDEVVSLDLTTAKVICGVIVECGDFKTNQKLRILHAKRRIIEAMQMVVQKDNDNSYPALKPNEDYTIKLGAETIYHFNKTYEAIHPYTDVWTEIQSFYDNAKEEYKKLNYQFSMDSAANLDAINKVKKVIVGNMIGVLKYIYNKYPCYLAFEDFDANQVESKKIYNEGDIYRLLERALLSGFREQGVVPIASELIAIRNRGEICKNDISQLGIIKYVPEGNTSLLCPCCGEKAYKGSNDIKYLEDKEQHIFKCVKCGYNNQSDTALGLNSNDAVAAFNIVKFSFNAERKYYILNPKFNDNMLTNIQRVLVEPNKKFDTNIAEFDEERYKELSNMYKNIIKKSEIDKTSNEYKEYVKLGKIREQKMYEEGRAIIYLLNQNNIFFRTKYDSKYNIVIVKGDKCKDKIENREVITEQDFLKIINQFINL